MVHHISYHIACLLHTSAELCTNHSCSYRHIEAFACITSLREGRYIEFAVDVGSNFGRNTFTLVSHHYQAIGSKFLTIHIFPIQECAIHGYIGIKIVKQ